ncbi:MAG TPA: PQQ-dependent sugar dehydrogenase, partial [Chloroflexota bacterium]|nr:PQQ-dependent sugar dehydrogenase [Chloroflexota bacterium]
MRPLLSLPLFVAALIVVLPARAAVDWPRPVLVPVVSGLTEPVHLTHAGDGTGRLFVVERAGRIRIIRNGALEASPFLDIRDRVEIGGAEQGLLSVAFPPAYGAKGYFYVYYTRRSDKANVIARYRLASADRADDASEALILVMPDPYLNHNGGIMLFGRDGYLYVGTGDGGSGGDPENRAQNLNGLLGKILRLDVESGTQPYAIPPSNPNLGGRREIWAYGLRNPWRIGFDRETADLYIADVGQNLREEVDFQPAASAGGENYGWRLLEGTRCFNPSTNCDPGGLTMPIAEYTHALGCSITGGFVYRGATYPRMRGIYFYGDFCSGRLWGLTRDGGVWTSQELLDSGRAISSF